MHPEPYQSLNPSLYTSSATVSCPGGQESDLWIGAKAATGRDADSFGVAILVVRTHGRPYNAKPYFLLRFFSDSDAIVGFRRRAYDKLDYGGSCKAKVIYLS